MRLRRPVHRQDFEHTPVRGGRRSPLAALTAGLGLPVLAHALRNAQRRATAHARPGAEASTPLPSSAPAPGAAEAALREAQRFLSSVIASAPVMINVYDRDGRITMSDGAVLADLGLKPGELVGQNCFERYRGRPEQIDGIRAALDGVSSTYESQRGDRIVELNHAPWRDAAGAIQGVVSTMTDITQRKLAERALHESEAFANAVFDNSPVAIHVFDAEGRSVRMNEAQKELMGLPSTSFGVGEFNILTSGFFNAAGISAHFRRAYAGEVVEVQDAQMEEAAGDPGAIGEARFAYDLTLFPIHDAAGQVTAVVSFTRDTTERKDAERARALAEERLHILLANMPLVMFAIDAEGVITFADGKLLAVPGRLPADIIGTSIFDFHQARPEALANVRRGLDGEDFVASAAIGDQFFESRYSPVRDATGKVAGLTWISVDITERVHGEQQLRESEERYRSTFEGLHDVFFMANLLDQFTMVSPSIEKANGWRPEEIVGTFTRALYVDPADHDRLVARIMTGVPVDDFEAVMTRKDGSTYVVSLNAKLVFNAAGEPVAVQGTARDITERRRAEDDRDRIFTLSVDMLSVFRAGGIIMRVNPAWTTTLGYPESDLVGKNVFDFAHPDERRRIMREASKVDRGIPVTDLRARFRHRDGTWRWLSWSIAAISDDATTYCVARDVTELMQSQQATLDARLELEETLEAMHSSQVVLQQQAEEMDRLRIEAEYLAGHDMLTEVMNRRAWFARAVAVRPSAIAIFDIDYFKKVNDTFGHPAGDEVLREVARRLESALPEGTLLGRLGGEEFGVLFTCDFAEARAAAGRAVAVVGETPVTLAGALSLTVTVSGGLAPWRVGPSSREESLAITYEEADAALYEAKDSGRHRLVVRGLKAA